MRREGDWFDPSLVACLLPYIHNNFLIGNNNNVDK
jgi:hypothetical protein